MSFSIATWNVNSLRVRLPQVLAWLAANPVDVLALQETKLIDADFPIADIRQAGYQALFSGQKTYNGVAILSREPALDVITDLVDFADPQRRILAATVGDVRIIDLYVPNGQAVGSDKYAYKLDWLESVRKMIMSELEAHPKLVVLGDFNIAPEDRDVHDPKAWEGQVLCSEPERSAFQNLMALGLRDSFRLHEQPEKSFSWWDYRMNAFQRNMGLRIDHILVSQALSERCKRCFIDTRPRESERPSDHAPVIAEFLT
jgi:exodeoxyribonuclease-3